MKPKIHGTAIVHPDAVLGEATVVGPYCIVESGVRIGNECELQSHVVLRGNTQLGSCVKVFPFAVLGAEPQHSKYRGEDTLTVIGDRVTIRESVTIHRGTPFGTGITSIGDDCLLMAYTHIAHDCSVGKGVIIANSVNLAGHAMVEDYATVGGMSGIIQHCRVGKFAYVGGISTIRKDFPPFLLGKGSPFEIQGVNAVGLQRKGFSEEDIRTIKAAYKIFYLQNLTVGRAIEKIEMELSENIHVRTFIEFVKNSKVGVIR